MSDYPLAGLNQYDGTSSERAVQLPTLKQRLELAVRQAEEQLANAKRAREIFDKNPDLEELLNIMQKGRF